MHTHTHRRRKRLACTFVHLTLHKHLIYVFSFTDHTLWVSKLLNMWNGFFFIFMVELTFKSTANLDMLASFIFLLLCSCHMGTISCLSTTLVTLSLLCGSQSETCRLLRQHAVSDIHAPPSMLLKTPFEKDFLQLYSWPQIKRTLLLYFYLFIYCGGSVCECMRACECVCVSDM